MSVRRLRIAIGPSRWHVDTASELCATLAAIADKAPYRPLYPLYAADGTHDGSSSDSDGYEYFIRAGRRIYTLCLWEGEVPARGWRRHAQTQAQAVLAELFAHHGRALRPLLYSNAASFVMQSGHHHHPDLCLIQLDDHVPDTELRLRRRTRAERALTVAQGTDHARLGARSSLYHLPPDVQASLLRSVRDGDGAFLTPH
jgi:hypothetical protein